MENKTAEILCVGTELLLGNVVNTNATFISQQLAQLGIGVYHHVVVGDNPQRLEKQLIHSLSRSDIVITTGGLGPTYDDLTKETVAKCLDTKMVLDDKALDQIKDFFSSIKKPMTDNNIKQAYVPKGSHVFYNDNGTAPGIALESKGKIVIMLPGPPKEMSEMFTKQVTQYLAKLSGGTIFSRSIHLFGIGEAELEQKLKDIMVNSTNPTVAPYAKLGEVVLRVSSFAKDEQQANSVIAPMIEKLQGICGEYIYGIDVENLQTALVKKLKENNLKIATAESCTGGYLSKSITDVSGSSAVFDCGICSYANTIKANVLGVKEDTLKEFGAVSEQVAIQMADGVRKLSSSDIGISTTGVAGPNCSEKKPVGLVYVGISTKDYSKSYKLNLYRGSQTTREIVRYLTCLNALNIAYKNIENMK